MVKLTTPTNRDADDHGNVNGHGSAITRAKRPLVGDTLERAIVKDCDPRDAEFLFLGEGRAKLDTQDPFGGASGAHGTSGRSGLSGANGFEVRSLGGAYGGGGAASVLGDGFSPGASVSAWLMSLGGDRELTRPYLQNPWVYACVKARANAISETRLKIVKDGPDGEPIEVEDHPLAMLLERPNPLHSQMDFLAQLSNYHSLFGETFLILLKGRRSTDRDGSTIVDMMPIEPGEMPEEIWPVRGDLVTEVCDERTQMPRYWRVAGGKRTVDYPVHAVVQISAVNPYSLLRGVGPMTAALRDAAKAYTGDRYDDALLKNGGQPGGVVTIDGPVSNAQLAAVKKAWQEAHGNPEAHGKTAVMGHGATYKPHGFTPKDMEFGEMRVWIRQSIMSVFGVTKTVLGITDDVNLANAREARRVFWESTVQPLVRFFEDQLTHKLLRNIKGKGFERGMRIMLDTSGVSALREDDNAKIERTLRLYSEGHRSFAEAARLAGWEIETSEGDGERWISSSLVPVEIALEGPPDPPPIAPPPAPPNGDEDDEGDDEDAGGGENDAADSDEDDDEAEADEKSASLSDPDYFVNLTKRAHRAAALDVYWKAHDRWLVDHETTFAKKTNRVFRDYLLAIRKRLHEIAEGKRSLPPRMGKSSVAKSIVITEAELERLLELNDARWYREMGVALNKPLKDILEDAARRLHAEVGGMGFLLDAEDPSFLRFLRNKEVLLSEGPLSTLAKSVQRNMVATIAKGPASVTTVAEAIAAVLDELNEDVKVLIDQAGRRAMMIARTEVTSSASFARLEQMKADGVTHHTWLSSRDAATRDEHGPPDGLDGKTVRVGEDFAPGLAHPGDNRAEPSMTIQCRCTTLPELPDDDFDDDE